MGPNRNAPSTGRSAPTLDRGRRCQNCRHFNNGPMAVQHYKMSRHRDLQAAAASVLGGEKVTPALLGQRLADDEKEGTKKIRPVRDLSNLNDQYAALGLNYELGDTLIETGQMGICLIGALPGDFVHFAALCEKWTEAVRPDGAEKSDELGDEARDRMGLDK